MLSQEEHFNLFEMTPQTAQDRYFNQIDSGTVKTQLVSTNDDNIDQLVQTDELTFANKFNQAPKDYDYNFNKDKTKYQRN